MTRVFGELGFGETGFGEMGFGEMGHNPSKLLSSQSSSRYLVPHKFVF